MKADFARWAAAPPSWAAGHDIGPVLSTRVRIARNLAGLPFPHNASSRLQSSVIHQVFDASREIARLTRAQTLSLNDLGPLQRGFLMERQLISHQHARAERECGLIVVPGEILSVMVNEEDHIRAAAFRTGVSLDEAWSDLAMLDEELSGRLTFAFVPDFGFETACPTNMGTGLRVSCLMHLPALVLSNQIGAVLEGLSRHGLTARGFYGEGTSAVGDLFQISNARTLGVSESQIIRNVEKAVRQVAAIETKESAELAAGNDRRALEDRVYRALGTLQQARLLEYVEGMRLLSLVRLGLRLGWPLEARADALNDLVFLAQPSHLRLRTARDGGSPEAALRAETVRGRLNGRAGN